MKHLCFLIIILIFSGCALNPKPLTFSSPPGQKSREPVTKSPYLQIVYPAAIKQKTLVSRSYFTGIANTLTIELGKNVGNVITEQASLYFDKIDIVDSTTARPAQTPRIEVMALSGEIGGTDLSQSGEMTINITDLSPDKKNSDHIFSR